MTRTYEAVNIFDSALEDAAIADKFGRFHALLSPEGEVKLEHWGRRQLAYPIKRRESGYYVIAYLTVDPKGLPEYERALKLDESVIRYLVTLHEHELGVPEARRAELAAKAARDGDDDDDED